jgi:hypothetical protein
VAKGFEKKGLASHVLLAACKDTQKAQEEYGRGLFSQALLIFLREGNLDKLTYAELIQELPALRRRDQTQYVFIINDPVGVDNDCSDKTHNVKDSTNTVSSSMVDFLASNARFTKFTPQTTWVVTHLALVKLRA